MMRRILFWVIPISIALLLCSCGEKIDFGGERHDVSVVFCENVHVHFGKDSVQDANWDRRDGGRLLVRNIVCPRYTKQPRVWARVTLTSAGDPWDKEGALLLLPADTTEPAIELMRFFTPFGVGHFSDAPRADEYRPVYVPAWEDSVSWEVDITHLLPRLQGEVQLGLHLDTWTDAGYEVSARLDFEGSPAQRHVVKKRKAEGLLNTLKYSAQQQLFTGFSDGPVSATWTADRAQLRAQLYYTASGHGGHDGGDEFTPCEHVLTLDGEEVLRYTPWRDDCASFRRFNPTSGVWTEPTFWKGDTIQERIASSDYSRSGWCPGSTAKTVKIDLGNLSPGSHQLEIGITEAQNYTDSTQNFWNVAAVLTYAE
jgi:hypothetical protein